VTIVDFELRPAREPDAAAIRRLVLVGGINPTGLDWRRFVVAVDAGDQVIGCGQLKPHGRDVLELASIAVEPGQRHRGIASAIITRLLEEPHRPLYLMCRSSLGPLYKKFGFTGLETVEMPTYFRRMSQLAGIVNTLARTGETLLVMKLQ
jgi:N-acetylglutamate synthase-like GNAT family acetyltransferase